MVKVKPDNPRSTPHSRGLYLPNLFHSLHRKMYSKGLGCFFFPLSRQPHIQKDGCGTILKELIALAKVATSVSCMYNNYACTAGVHTGFTVWWKHQYLALSWRACFSVPPLWTSGACPPGK